MIVFRDRSTSRAEPTSAKTAFRSTSEFRMAIRLARGPVPPSAASAGRPIPIEKAVRI
jgi:hypothetical protein